MHGSTKSIILESNASYLMLEKQILEDLFLPCLAYGDSSCKIYFRVNQTRQVTLQAYVSMGLAC